MLSAIKRLWFRLQTRICTAYAKGRVGAFGPGFTVNFPCQFTPQTHIGRNCHFNGMRVRGAGRLTIGDYFHSGEEIMVITQNHNYRNPTKLPYDEAYAMRDVAVGRYVWVGSRAILLPGVELGDGCIVQAGAVVAGKYPANSIVGGNPAKVIGMRDADVVDRLVAAGSFLN